VYQRQAGPVIELQLEKAGVRLAYLLNGALEVKDLACLWRSFGARRAW